MLQPRNLRALAMKEPILCDFDGTISARKTEPVLDRHFTSGNWEAINRDFRQGMLGPKKAYSQIEKERNRFRLRFLKSFAKGEVLVAVSGETGLTNISSKSVGPRSIRQRPLLPRPNTGNSLFQ
jgi:hypothetical protein